MKRALKFLVVIGVMGLITYLAVTGHLSQQRADRLDRALMDAEARVMQLEEEIEAAKARLAELARTQALARPPVARPSATPAGTPTAPPAPQTVAESVAAPPSTDTTGTGPLAPVPGAGIAGAWPRYAAFAAGVTNLVRIEGTSTIHDWQVEGHLVGGSAELGPGFLTRPGAEARPGPVEAKGNVFIPVRSLKSVEKDGRPYSDAMDEIMYGKLLAETHRRITYTLTSLTLKEPPHEAGAPFLYEATGKLTVAGVTNTIIMPVSVSLTAGGPIRFAGSVRVKMTDFKIQPPQPSVGGLSIKTGDEVTLKFVWWVNRAAAPEAAK